MSNPDETPAERFERLRAELGKSSDPQRNAEIRAMMIKANAEDIAQYRTEPAQ